MGKLLFYSLQLCLWGGGGERGRGGVYTVFMLFFHPSFHQSVCPWHFTFCRHMKCHACFFLFYLSGSHIIFFSLILLHLYIYWKLKLVEDHKVEVCLNSFMITATFTELYTDPIKKYNTTERQKKWKLIPYDCKTDLVCKMASCI